MTTSSARRELASPQTTTGPPSSGRPGSSRGNGSGAGRRPRSNSSSPSIQEAVAPARVVNDHRNQSRQSIHVQIGPGAVAVDGTGKGPIEIGEEAADALYERLRERLEGEAQQVSDTVFTDPDPTLSF